MDTIVDIEKALTHIDQYLGRRVSISAKASAMYRRQVWIHDDPLRETPVPGRILLSPRDFQRVAHIVPIYTYDVPEDVPVALNNWDKVIVTGTLRPSSSPEFAAIMEPVESTELFEPLSGEGQLRRSLRRAVEGRIPMECGSSVASTLSRLDELAGKIVTVNGWVYVSRDSSPSARMFDRPSDKDVASKRLAIVFPRIDECMQSIRWLADSWWVYPDLAAKSVVRARLELPNSPDSAGRLEDVEEICMAGTSQENPRCYHCCSGISS